MDDELAPTGKFRVGMNGNNSNLVTHNADGSVSGLSSDLGRFIAAKLGTTYEPVVYDSAAPYTASFHRSEWDIVLTGRNAVVEKLLDFSADLFLIDYGYVAAPGHGLDNPGQVDRAGIRIAVPRNASADVYLSRTLKTAQLVRVDGDLNAGIEMLRAGQAEVYASNINSVQKMADRVPGAKVLGAFQTMVFAVAMQKGRSAAAMEKLTCWVNEAKATGLVQAALERAGAKGARVVA